MNLHSNNFKLISIGNRKIHTNTVIFNCSSYENCTSRKLGLCSISHVCYAKKAEYLYKQSKAYRDRQEEYILNVSTKQLITTSAKSVKTIGKLNTLIFCSITIELRNLFFSSVFMLLSLHSSVLHCM